MKYYPANTLAYLMQHPVLAPLDMRKARVPNTVANIDTFRNSYTMAVPEESALTFYGMNHLVNMIRQKYGLYTPLPEWALTVVKDYTQWLSVEARRMVGYLTLITTRESRHLHDMPSEWVEQYVNKFGKEAWDFHIHHMKGGLHPMQAVQKLIEHPPVTTMDDFIGGHVFAFREGSFGGAFGGEPWAVIAETLHRAVKGDTSLEVMVDTAYTLAHNGGPMFNKGMLYSDYDASHLVTILDVQRAGQIPSLIVAKNLNQYTLPTFVYEAIGNVGMHIEPIKDWVDWDQVEKLGAVQTYDHYKKMQKMATVPGALKVVEILPGVQATTITREAAKAAMS